MAKHGTEAAETLGGVTFLITGGMNGPGVVVAAKLPHESARQALEKALTQPDLFVFRKGVSVRLDVSAIPPAEQARVRDALTKKLAGLDIRVVPDAPVTLAAGVDPPKHKEFLTTCTATTRSRNTPLGFVYGTSRKTCGSLAGRTSPCS